MKKSLIISSLLISTSLLARPLNYETTRLKSTGGAGAASFLMNEATVSNPAPLAFFVNSSFYLEKYSAEQTNLDGSTENDNYAIIASDSSKNLKGSIAYIKSNIDSYDNRQMNAALASPIGQRSSLGFSYQDIKRSFDYKDDKIEQNYKMVNVGLFHAINKSLTLGFVAVDPMKKQITQSRGLMGLQYQFLDYFVLMADVGANYNRSSSDNSIYKLGAQIRIFNDFFLRVGKYSDDALSEEGTGFGLGWVGPKLVFEFAIKKTELAENEELYQEKETIKETSFSLSYKF